MAVSWVRFVPKHETHVLEKCFKKHLERKARIEAVVSELMQALSAEPPPRWMNGRMTTVGATALVDVLAIDVLAIGMVQFIALRNVSAEESTAGQD
eukprot:6464363-Amphidinium_carterae.1